MHLAQQLCYLDETVQASQLFFAVGPERVFCGVAPLPYANMYAQWRAAEAQAQEGRRAIANYLHALADSLDPPSPEGLAVFGL